MYPFIGSIARTFERYASKDVSDYQLISIAEPKDYEIALKKDLNIFLKKIYKFNVHHLDIDQKILLDDEYTLAEKQYASYHLTNDQLDEDYDILKNIEEALLR